MNDNITTCSNDCLFELKELIRECVTTSCLDIDCDELLDTLTCEIDIDKFKAWLNRNLNTFKTKQNIQSYFKRAFYKELEKGTFKVKKEIWNGNTLFQALREKGVIVIHDDTCYICLMWEAYQKLGVKIDLVQDLNHKIVNYMHEGQTSQDYINLVRKANALKDYQIDWDKLQQEYEVEIAEWHDILNGLENLEVSPND